LNILITGINGFLGRELAIYLNNLGHKIFGISKNNVKEKLNDIIYLNYDLINLGNIGIDNNIKIDLIYHLAWSNLSEKNNYETQVNNLILSKNILDYSVKNKIKKIIFIGSTLEYSSIKPIEDSTIIAPQNFYGLLKSQIRSLLQFYRYKYHLNVIYVVTTSVYGIGRNDTNIIDYTIDKLKKSELPIYENLKQLWSFLFIEDFLIMISNIGLKINSFSLYFIGNTECSFLYTYIERIFHLFGRKFLQIEFSNAVNCSCVNLKNYVSDYGLPILKNFDYILSTIEKT
jgi:nucleoside-diphosphate-sugar epimerase